MLLTKYQRDSEWVKGDLTIEEEFDKQHCRWSRVARLHGVIGYQHFPPLYDATVLVLNSDRLTITGFELGHNATLAKPACFHQSWFVTPPREPSVWPIPQPEKA